MEFDIETYAMLIVPMIMWVSAQIIKFLIYSVRHGLDWKYLFEYGHMPSSHTTCVTSLMFATGYYAGIDSAAFAVAFTFGALTIYDAVKLRSYVGEYGKTLNKLTRETSKRDYPHLKERVGHTVYEVMTGVLLGIIGSYFLTCCIDKLI